MNPNSPSSPQGSRRLRDRLREVTMGAILDAAEQVFAAEGPRARIESIANRAGIAVGTVYNHFADRDALWAELSRSRRAALLVRLDAALEQGRSQPFDCALRTFLGAFLAHWVAHRGFLALLIAVDPMGSRTLRSGPKDKTMAAELLERATSLVERGIASGAVRGGQAELHAALLLGMVRAVLFRHLDASSTEGQAEADLDRLVELFLRGAGPRGPGGPAREDPA